jgi:hypothetical protein
MTELRLEQVNSYERNGFLAPIRVAKSDQAAAWRRELEENERNYGRLHYVAKAHLVLDFAHRLASHPLVLDAVSSIIGPDILLWDSTFIIKEPGDGKKVSWGAVGGNDRERLHAHDPGFTYRPHCCPLRHEGNRQYPFPRADYCRADRPKTSSVRGSCAW